MSWAALTTLALLGSGVVAGVMFAVALSVVPALGAMPADRYIYAHRLIGRNWDPTLPIIVLCSTALDIAMALVAGDDRSWLFGAGAALLLGVSVVSHFCNVPINRRVKAVDPQDIPPDWQDPRPLWSRFHLTRTALAIAAFTVNSVAVVLGR